MDTAAKPIITTTSLSFLLHGLAFAGLVLGYDQLVIPDEGVGRGVEIQLISSVLVSYQHEADVPLKQEAEQHAVTESLLHVAKRDFSENVLTSLNSTQAIVVTESEEEELIDKNVPEQQHEIKQNTLSVYNSESFAAVAQSTNASQQQHTIVELLHSHINDNKEYPYLARRQRREGVATVAFVLNPDGTIENARLVSSSRTMALDHAALSAVKKIEPFKAAQQYLKRPEIFQVDIEFELL